MADLLNEVTSKEFGRKSFLKGGGALVVGFSLAGAGAAGDQRRAEPEQPAKQHLVQLRQRKPMMLG